LLSGQVDYTDRNLVEKWFHTLKMWVDRFHNSWVGSRQSVRQCLALFMHYYRYLRPHQSLDGRTPVEEVLNWTAHSFNLVIYSIYKISVIKYVASVHDRVVFNPTSIQVMTRKSVWVLESDPTALPAPNCRITQA
jgi:hypothetical protein